ncbi:MAG: response regulator, partial [Mariprofundus sp.]|nr:response regulator [Mariprofundus sp.]
EPFIFESQTERRSFFWGRDKKGDFVYYDDYNHPSGKGYVHEEWYVTSRYLPPSRCFWSKSYMDPYSFQPMVTCTVGWFEQGKFSGTATVDLKLEGIAEKLEVLQKKIGGYAVIMDRNGKFIAFPKAGDSAKLITYDVNRNRVEEFLTANEFARQHPLFKAIADADQQHHQHILQQAKLIPAFDSTLAAKLDHDSYQINANEAEFISAVIVDPLAQHTLESYLLSKTHIENDTFLHQPSSVYLFHVPDTYWTLAIIKATAEESLVASQLAESLFFKLGGLIVVLIFMAYLFLRFRIVNPLTHMAANVGKADDAMKRGRLSVELDDLQFETTLNNEVAILGQGFQHLLHAFADAQQTIEEQNINLEKRIIERTDALRAKETELSNLLDSMNEVHFKLANDHKFTDISEALAGMFGVSVAELQQHAVLEYFSDSDDFSDFIFKLEQEETVKAYEWKLVHADSSICWLSVNARIFRNQHGAVQNIQGLLTNITHEKTMQDEKENMQRKMEHVQRLESLGILAGGIAHDFNNLLTAIMGNASLAELNLNEHAKANAKTLGMMQQIQLASKRAAYLCAQMLAYSGKGQFIIRPINLTHLLEEMVGLLRVSIDKSIELDCQLMEGLPNIDGDESQMQQVIMNLVINASEAINGKEGKITCKTSIIQADRHLLNTSYLDEGLSEGRYVQMLVEDNGCGMSKETQSHIFDPFFTTKFTGRGLGMSALLGIIRGHHGGIMVYSELGEGSIFRVLLPLSQGPQHTEDEEDTHLLSQEQQRGMILLVDDEENVRDMATLMIENMGFQALVAHNGKQAIELYQQHMAQIELVLLDYIMPKMNGHEVFAELIKFNPDVRVVLTSGYTEIKATAAFKHTDLYGFLQKPYDFGIMNKIVKQALES